MISDGTFLALSFWLMYMDLVPFLLIAFVILVVMILMICALSGTEGSSIRSSRISDFGTLEQTLGFRLEDAVDIGRSM